MAKSKGRTGRKQGKTGKVARRATVKKARPAAAKKPAAAKVPAAAKKPVAAARAAAPAPATVGPDPVRELAKRIVDLTVTGDDEAAFALYADTIESVEPGAPPAMGIEAIKQKFAMWRGMVSDSSWNARHVWVFGNTIIIEWEAHVTLAATGKRAALREVAIHEVQNGKIVRERFYYDRSALMP
jgi:ketosteroid isomerase-like protein